MHMTPLRALSLVGLFGATLALAQPVSSGTEGGSQAKGHTKVTGVVTKARSGLLSVKLPDGSTHTLNPNAAQRHGHEVPKVGDEVTVVLDENNTVIEVHPKGEEGTHRFVTGKLIHLGKTTKQIKLSTPEGEKTFPIERMEIKTKGIDEGTLVTVELNEAGTAIDLHRADAGGGHP